MRDRRLESNITRVEGFVERWKQLSLFLERGFHGENITDDEESAFLELKSQIAQEYEMLMATLGPDGDRSDKPLRLLSILPSLQGLRDLSEGTDKRVASDWHSLYLLLQALLGRLKGRQLQLASVSSFRVGLKRIFGNPFVVVLLFAASCYGVYRLALDLMPKLVEIGDKLR